MLGEKSHGRAHKAMKQSRVSSSLKFHSSSLTTPIITFLWHNIFATLMTLYILKCPMQTHSSRLSDEMWATSGQIWTSALRTQRYNQTWSQSRFHGNILPWLPSDWLSELVGAGLVDIFYPEKNIIQAFISLPVWSMVYLTPYKSHIQNIRLVNYCM